LKGCTKAGAFVATGGQGGAGAPPGTTNGGGVTTAGAVGTAGSAVSAPVFNFAGKVNGTTNTGPLTSAL
jgi:hypothetical protein